MLEGASAHHGHSQSEWWERMESFSRQSEKTESRLRRRKSVPMGILFGGRGFRLNRWRPLFLSMFVRGPHILRRFLG